MYLCLSYALALPLKDFKDVAGDVKDGVTTLPVALGIQKTKALMSAIVFLLFLGSIFVMHTPELLVWALLFGSASFWIIQKTDEVGIFSYRRLPAIFMALATFYGLGVTFFLL
jgi:4-hydroxybenzoate polyprenyltransferase